MMLVAEALQVQAAADPALGPAAVQNKAVQAPEAMAFTKAPVASSQLSTILVADSQTDPGHRERARVAESATLAISHTQPHEADKWGSVEEIPITAPAAVGSCSDGPACSRPGRHTARHMFSGGIRWRHAGKPQCPLEDRNSASLADGNSKGSDAGTGHAKGAPLHSTSAQKPHEPEPAHERNGAVHEATSTEGTSTEGTGEVHAERQAFAVHDVDVIKGEHQMSVAQGACISVLTFSGDCVTMHIGESLADT
jgi:hypothetical protein